MSKTPKHILVIRLSAMGDVAMTIPVLSAFVEHHPQVKITVLTRAFFAPFFRDISQVTVFPIDINGKHKGFVGLFKLAKELKKLKIDAVADLHNVLRTKILKLFLFGKKFMQIDKGRSEKKALVSGNSFHQLKTTHERYADVFRKLGFKIDLENTSFPEKCQLSSNILLKTGAQDKKWIGIAPFATYQSKMYPLDAMEIVIKALSEKHQVLLFGGGSNEIKLLNTLESKFNNVMSLAGKLTLNEELDIISNLNVMLSMDSGNAHIAAMLGTKVVTIWGVTHPYAGFAPFNQLEDYCLVSDRKKYPLIPTSVYGNKYPETYIEAARSISTENIINTIESII